MNEATLWRKELTQKEERKSSGPDKKNPAGKEKDNLCEGKVFF